MLTKEIHEQILFHILTDLPCLSLALDRDVSLHIENLYPCLFNLLILI